MDGELRSGSTWSEEAKLLSSGTDPFFLKFGWSVSLDGDTALVGAIGDAHLCPAEPFTCLAGSAYLFERNQGGPNNWGLVKRIIPGDPAQGQRFGLSTALGGETAIVSAPGDSSQKGAVYVFERDAGGAGNWGEVQNLVASDGQSFDSFGQDVVIDGNTLVVGAIFEDGSCEAPDTDCGAAYVFIKTAGTWVEDEKLMAADPSMLAGFGTSVAIEGEQVLVGATYRDDLPGAAYVFERDARGIWQEVQKLLPSDSPGADWGFGASVALAGEIAAVGAPLADHECPGDPECDSGAAYVFRSQEIFADGFESGDTSAWSAVVE